MPFLFVVIRGGFSWWYGGVTHAQCDLPVCCVLSPLPAELLGCLDVCGSPRTSWCWFGSSRALGASWLSVFYVRPFWAQLRSRRVLATFMFFVFSLSLFDCFPFTSLASHVGEVRGREAALHVLPCSSTRQSLAWTMRTSFTRTRTVFAVRVSSKQQRSLWLAPFSSSDCLVLSRPVAHNIVDMKYGVLPATRFVFCAFYSDTIAAVESQDQWPTLQWHHHHLSFPSTHTQTKRTHAHTRAVSSIWQSGSVCFVLCGVRSQLEGHCGFLGKFSACLGVWLNTEEAG